MNIKLIGLDQLRALKSSAIRAARELRDETGCVVLRDADPRAYHAWCKLDEALNELDDYCSDTMGKEGGT